ncbi:hypothetical protein HDN1F_29790 [gamma proteobacterium HdN1]|nr:hypothetical protein HDN1F_29790 [gamma proteobacterium HdN1]
MNCFFGNFLLPVNHSKLTSRSIRSHKWLLGRRYAAPITSTCVPGMAVNSSGESPDTRYSQSRRLAKGQGRHREVRSKGSPRQNRGAMNKNRI